MRKIVKYPLITAGMLLLLPLAAIAIISATFDPNDYKPQIIEMVKEKKNRTLSIPGDIKLTFFPRIGIELGKASLSERDKTEEFASFSNAKISVALMPLLSKKVVIDHVTLEGMHARFHRYKDGTTNIDDLLPDDKAEQKQEPPAQPIDFAIDGISITNANIAVDDRLENRSFDISKLNLETGHVASGAPGRVSLTTDVKASNPQIAASLAVNSGFQFNLEQQHFVLNDLDTQLSGTFADLTDLLIKISGNADLAPQAQKYALSDLKLEASGKQAGQTINASISVPALRLHDNEVKGGELKASVKLLEGDRTLTASFAAPAFEGSAKAFRLPGVALDAVIRQGPLDAKARLSGEVAGDLEKMLFTSPRLHLALDGKQGSDVISGSLSTPLSADLKARMIELSRIGAAFTLPNPGGGILKLAADGRVQANLARETVSAGLKGSLDESNFEVRAGLSNFSRPDYNFDISVDKIDADRYRSKTTSKEPVAPGQAEQPIDLSGLKSLRANGSVRVGSLKAANVRASKVRLELRATGGKVEISPMEANLYGGSMSGAISATASNAPRFSIRQNLAGIDLGPLLKDALDIDPIEGKGNVQLNIDTQGATVTQLKKGAHGNASLALRDGAVRGINLGKALRTARNSFNTLRGKEMPQSGSGSASEKTDFTELTGSFTITNGIVKNNDLNAKSPLLRIGGAGTVNLVEDRLEYLVKTAVVTTSKGQDGPELESLKGITIPVKLAGPFTAIDWSIDFRGMMSERAEQKIEEKKDALKAKAREEVSEQKAKVQEKLQDKMQEKLKGLLLR